MKREHWITVLMVLAASLSTGSYMQWANDPNRRTLGHEVHMIKQFFGFEKDTSRVGGYKKGELH